MKRRVLQCKCVFGNLRIIEFDTGRSMDAATRMMMRIRICGDSRSIRSRSSRVRIYISNNVEEPTRSNPNVLCWNLEGGVDPMSKKRLQCDFAIATTLVVFDIVCIAYNFVVTTIIIASIVATIIIDIVCIAYNFVVATIIIASIVATIIIDIVCIVYNFVAATISIASIVATIIIDVVAVVVHFRAITIPVFAAGAVATANTARFASFHWDVADIDRAVFVFNLEGQKRRRQAQ